MSGRSLSPDNEVILAARAFNSMISKIRDRRQMLRIDSILNPVDRDPLPGTSSTRSSVPSTHNLTSPLVLFSHDRNQHARPTSSPLRGIREGIRISTDNTSVHLPVQQDNGRRRSTDITETNITQQHISSSTITASTTSNPRIRRRSRSPELPPGIDQRQTHSRQRMDTARPNVINTSSTVSIHTVRSMSINITSHTRYQEPPGHKDQTIHPRTVPLNSSSDSPTFVPPVKELINSNRGHSPIYSQQPTHPNPSPIPRTNVNYLEPPSHPNRMNPSSYNHRLLPVPSSSAGSGPSRVPLRQELITEMPLEPSFQQHTDPMLVPIMKQKQKRKRDVSPPLTDDPIAIPHSRPENVQHEGISITHADGIRSGSTSTSKRAKITHSISTGASVPSPPTRQRPQLRSASSSDMPLVFQLGASVQVRHLIENSKVGSNRYQRCPLTWSKWESGVIEECRRIGDWVDSIDTIPPRTSNDWKWEYKVRISSPGSTSNGDRKGKKPQVSRHPSNAIGKWYRIITGDIRPIGTSRSKNAISKAASKSKAKSKSAPNRTPVNNDRDDVDHETKLKQAATISSEEAAQRTMLWAKFQNLFPRDESFRITITRQSAKSFTIDSEGSPSQYGDIDSDSGFVRPSKPSTSARPHARASSSFNSNKEASKKPRRNVGAGSDLDPDSDSSESYVPSLSLSPSLVSAPAQHPIQKAAPRKSKSINRNPRASKAKSIDGEPGLEDPNERPFLADIWLPFQITVWHEPHPKGKILLPCLIDPSLSTSSSSPSDEGTNVDEDKGVEEQNVEEDLEEDDNDTDGSSSRSSPVLEEQIFTPTKYTGYSRFNEFEKLCRGSDVDVEAGGTTSGSTDTNADGAAQWLYNANDDMFVCLKLNGRSEEGD